MDWNQNHLSNASQSGTFDYVPVIPTSDFAKQNASGIFCHMQRGFQIQFLDW